MATDQRAAATPVPSGGRDAFVDFMRAFSLFVVVTWHWVFTIVIWRSDGPHATTPSASRVACGCSPGCSRSCHCSSTSAATAPARLPQRAGVGTAVGRPSARLRRLKPSAGPPSSWWGGGLGVLGACCLNDGGAGAVMLVISPLWFIAMYLMLVLLLPIILWLHLRFGRRSSCSAGPLSPRRHHSVPARPAVARLVEHVLRLGRVPPARVLPRQS